MKYSNAKTINVLRGELETAIRAFTRAKGIDEINLRAVALSSLYIAMDAAGIFETPLLKSDVGSVNQSIIDSSCAISEELFKATA